MTPTVVPTIQQCIRQLHASWLMDSSTNPRPGYAEKMRTMAAARNLSDELQVVSANAEIKGQTLEVSIAISNQDVAPFYAGRPVEVRVLKKAGSAVTTILPINLKSLLSKASDSAVARLELTNIPAGDLILQISAPNPMKSGRSLHFANANSEPISSDCERLARFRSPPPE